MFEKLINPQLLKFIVVGISNTLISYIVFFGFYNFVLLGNAFLSQCISYAAGVLWSFNWNKKWTFSGKKHRWSVFIPFATVQVTLLFLSAFSISIANHNLNWNVNLIWLCVMVIITVINYNISKYLVFRV
ncbi:MAG: GtrA family protein [Tissierellales bacterium]|nr:GtrA family protein [Tissierellales bacterium]